MLTAPPSVSAVEPQRRSKTVTTISYHTAAPRLEDSVQAAARAWNEADVGVRFKARPKKAADVVIRTDPELDRCGGVASVPPQRRDAPPKYGKGSKARVRLAEKCPSATERALVTAHELGHILGIYRHEWDRCAVMGPSGDTGGFGTGPPEQCSPAEWRRLRCRLVTGADVRAARRLYGYRSSAGGEQGRPCVNVGPAQGPLIRSDRSGMSVVGWLALAMLGAVVVLGLAALVHGVVTRGDGEGP
ncbi:MAG: hypothetical protein M3133_08695 [Actinomycetota bacterium]|nr:hypothetical protein [Actinomycetota bacterium]